ncbi:MAG: hypothetical protein AAF298_11215 [Cyanobacteria bacterium P01_A01_bin.40]
MSLLSERITSHLQKVVSQKLIDVYLSCFDYEIEPLAMENLPFYFGGELILNFERDIAIVTWDEKAGWQDHFSLYVGCEHLYLPTSNLVKWNVSKLKPWRNCINRKLTSVQIYGQNQTPHVVKLNFTDIVLFIGDSSEKRLGDGDDLLITTELSANYYGKWNMIWEAK